MKFINIWVLAVLPLVMTFVLLLAMLAASRRRAALRAIYGQLGGQGRAIVSRFRRQVRYILLFALVAVLSLAAARPWWGEIRSSMSGRGSDVVFVLDTSKSMLAEDASPSRLAHAKYLIREIVKDNPDDRFALVLFSGDALPACPLTGDGESFDRAVDEADCDSIPIGGTNVQRALQLVARAFSGAEGASRAVVMITDGEQLDGDASAELAEFKQSGIPLFVLGVGSTTEAATIPLRDGSGAVRQMFDAKGDLVRTKLDENLLRNLASGAGGRYFHAGNVVTNLDALNRELSRLTTVSYDGGSKPQPIERFMPFIVAATLLLLGFLMISERPRRLIALLFLAAATIAKADDAAKTPAAPVTAPATAQAAKLENWELYQQARAEQLDGDEAKARESYEAALQSDGDRRDLVGSYSYHNLGVLEHGKARGGIKEAGLKLRAQDPDAALKAVDGSLENLKAAEEFYLNAWRNGAVEGADTAAAQQLLLLDIDEANKLKKDIEELKRRQEQAKKDAQAARQQNQQSKQDQQGEPKQDQQSKQDQQGESKQDQQGEPKQDQQGEPKQDQQGEPKQDQQGEPKQDQQGEPKQDQQGEPKQDQQGEPKQDKQGERKKGDDSAAQQATDKAGQSADKLREQAEKLGQQQMKQRAERAREELEKARNEQQKGNYDQADQNISNAMDELDAADSKPEPEQKKDGKPQDRQGEESGNEGKDQPKDEDARSGKPSGSGRNQAQEKIDPKMADAMLKMLNGDERDYRKRLEQLSRGGGAPRMVEKDW